MLQEKVIKFNTICEKVKQERNQYKEAWDNTDKKYIAAKKKWENELFEL